MSAGSDETPLSFEQSLSDLQRIVSELESGSLGLEQSLARFEQGIGILRHCHQVLESAEQRIEILTGTDAEGNPTFAPFDATATASQQGQSAGRRPRKKPAKPTPTETPPAPAGTEPPPWESASEEEPETPAPPPAEPAEDDWPRLF